MKVLVVDDDSVARKTISKALEDTYIVTTAVDGPTAIDMVPVESPDLILLDVEMPFMSGFEVCNQIKTSNGPERDTPIIFISSLSSMSERLHGLEVGADDFLTKPFEPEMLKAKLNKLLAFRQERDGLKQQVDAANNAAYQAMSGTSEFGTAIRFVERSHSIGTFELLADQFFKATDQFGLSCSLMMKTESEPLFFTSNHASPAVSPLEKELITMLSTAERFNDFGQRTQINYPYISLLVKNMPSDEPDRYGRYKDLLPFMIEVANATVRTLNIESQLVSQTRNLGKSFDIVKQTLMQLTDAMQVNQENVASIMNDMLMELDEVVPGLGLDEDQETYLIKRIDGAVTEANEVLDSGANLKGSIINVTRLLDHLVEQQHIMVDKAIASKASTSEVQDEQASVEEEVHDEDVELF
ncbi:response regulator transcription factor [Litoribacillus peritrichatus]|uniref:Response regulatory domain-containing protein n=1 Tax=Litoribacillus peritrichatus TaxID=718191 RepID=A0ABP7NAK7_9GAMM